MGRTRLVEFMSDNGSVIVELAEEATGPLPASTLGEKIGRANKSLPEAIAGIEPIARAVLAQMEALKPDQATVELGLKFTAKAGVVLAATESEGHLKLSLTWKKST